MLGTASVTATEGKMISTLLLTREFSIASGEAGDLEFRIEIFGIDEADLPNRIFKVRVWRYETFHLLPLSEVARDELFDHTILVLDDMFDSTQVTASSPEEAFNHCRSSILAQLFAAK